MWWSRPSPVPGAFSLLSVPDGEQSQISVSTAPVCSSRGDKQGFALLGMKIQAQGPTRSPKPPLCRGGGSHPRCTLRLGQEVRYHRLTRAPPELLLCPAAPCCTVALPCYSSSAGHLRGWRVSPMPGRFSTTCFSPFQPEKSILDPAEQFRLENISGWQNSSSIILLAEQGCYLC